MKKILVFITGLLAFVQIGAQIPADTVGVFAVANQELTRIDCLQYSHTKISGAVVMAKSKLCFDGQTSKNQFTAKAVFRLYFGVPSAADVRKYYMFTPSYSAKDFDIVKFKVKKGRRYLTTSTVSVVGGRMGAKQAKDVQVKTVQLKPNVYEITVTGPAGEYALTPAVNGVAGFAGVFDFTLL